MPPQPANLQNHRRGPSQGTCPDHRLSQWAAKLEMESLTLKKALQSEFRNVRELVAIEQTRANQATAMADQLTPVIEAHAESLRSLTIMTEKNSKDLESIKQYLSSLIPRLENIELYLKEIGDDDNCIQVLKHN